MKTKKQISSSSFFMPPRAIFFIRSLNPLLFLLIFTASLFSQEEPGNINELRQEWYESQRFYPYDSLQQSKVLDALEYQQEMREENGYYLAPVSNWTSIGPTPYYNGSTPLTGRVMSVKYDPNNPNIIYIAGHNGGIWKSTNGQVNWQDVVFQPKTDAPFFQTQSSGAIAIAPSNSSIIYYGTGGGMYFAINYPGVGVYKSTNYGDNWTGPYKLYINSSPIVTNIFRMAVHPYNPNVVYMAERNGLWLTINGGVNWTRVIPAPGLGSRWCNDVVIADYGWNFPAWIYAVGPSQNWTWGNQGDLWKGIEYWVSTNGGISFFQPANLGFTPGGRTHISVSKANHNRVYAVTVDIYDGGKVKAYSSVNGGLNFYNQFTLINRGSMANSMLFIHASPVNPLVAFVGFGDAYTCRHPDGSWHLWRTTNGGVTYEPICSPYADQTNFDFHPTDPNQILLSNDGGLWRSTNAGANASQVSFQSLNKTLSLCEGFRVTSNPYNPEDVFFAQTDNGFLKKDAGLLSWTSKQQCCDGTNILYSRTNQGVIVASTGVHPSGYNYTIWNSLNNGSSFIERYVPGIADGDLEWIKPIAEHPNTAGTFFTIRRQPAPNDNNINLIKSTDNGSTWQVVQGTPINTFDPSNAPQILTIYQGNPLIMYAGTNSRSQQSQLFKSTNGGGSWIQDLYIHQHGIPDRFLTCVTTDPCNQNIVYLTLSGYGTNHVFKTIDGGFNWFSISGSSLPDIPVNFLMLRYISSSQKELIVATDAGVYRSVDNGLNSWQELAGGLPNTVASGLELNLLSGKLRASTFGRGVYETRLQGPIYVPCRQVLSDDPSTAGLEVIDDIIVSSGGILEIPNICTIRMPENKKIIIEDGGQIDVTSNDPVYFTSQSGSWGGIEIQDGGYGNIQNCVFSNTETPITINSHIDGGDTILINNCTFNGGSVSISGRNNVTITQCTTNTASATTGTAINAIYSDNLVLSQNKINNCWAAGIMVSNSSPVILSNVINHALESNSSAGMSLDNCYSGTVNYNQVYNCNYGIYLYYSSPTLLENIVINNTTSAFLDPSALYANYLSSPRLKPTSGEGGTIWDGGLNELKTNNQGNGIYIYDMSIPNIDYGYNKIHGSDYHLSGSIGNGEENEYYAIDNCWAPNYPPLREDISDATVIDDPYTCDPPGGGAESGDDPASVAEEELLPPPPIIINYGNGIFDTIKVTSGQLPLSADQLLFSQGLDAEIAGNYQVAINKYLQVVQNYQDSNSAISSMKKILYCKDKMHADTNAYTVLRTYYQNLAQQNPNDTGFVKAAKEMASKCLVRMGQCSGAITEYEAVVQNSVDSLEVLCAELNIIETYMIMERGGDSPEFTGQLKQLKPVSVLDGIKMINEKLHRVQPNKIKPVVPEVFSLSQNYPNPFNPLTKINYAIPKRSNVTLKIYDILGRLVKTLVNEFKEPGFYTVQFDGSEFSSGVYFYTIDAGEYRASKKMVLVK